MAAIVTSARTWAGMRSRIIRELGGRSALSSVIDDAIADAIAEYQKERFRFSESVPNAEATFATVANRAVYTSADNANIGTLYRLDYLLLQVGNTWVELIQDSPKNLKLYNQTTTMVGQPSWWAYEGNQIILAAIPAQVYTAQMGLFKNVAAPAADDEVDNVWMTSAERLIRSRAKFEIATHQTRNADMATAMSPYPPDQNGGKTGAAWSAWCSLKAETNRVTSLKKIRPMAF